MSGQISTLNGRVAVVTGASSGIGEATARLLAENGARVALVARRQDRLEQLAKEITAAGGTAVAVAADLAAGGGGDLAERVTSAVGEVDLVVANAGVMLAAPFSEGRTQEWEQMVDINLSGLLSTVNAFVPSLLAVAGRGGTADLVTISSVAATSTFPNFAVYCATKAAVSHLARNLRTELGPKDVRVTNIEPGVVVTELQGHVDHPETNAMLDEWVRTLAPLEAKDIASVIGYATGMPRNVNLANVVAMPTRQA
jgi:NADP-dependent 3-hydroxy acid dehydrogenase YdfG